MSPILEFIIFFLSDLCIFAIGWILGYMDGNFDLKRHKIFEEKSTMSADKLAFMLLEKRVNDETGDFVKMTKVKEKDHYILYEVSVKCHN